MGAGASKRIAPFPAYPSAASANPADMQLRVAAADSTQLFLQQTDPSWSVVPCPFATKSAFHFDSPTLPAQLISSKRSLADSTLHHDTAERRIKVGTRGPPWLEKVSPRSKMWRLRRRLWKRRRTL